MELAGGSTLRVENLSNDGAFIASQIMLPIGSEFSFRMQLPDSDTLVQGRARVARADPVAGLGVEFLGLSQAMIDDIDAYLRRITEV